MDHRPVSIDHWHDLQGAIACPDRCLSRAQIEAIRRQGNGYHIPGRPLPPQPRWVPAYCTCSGPEALQHQKPAPRP